MRSPLGLDKPLLEQLFQYVAALARGDMGLSLTTGQPVAQELLARLPACVIALPLGMLAATRPGSWIDQLCRLLSTAGVSLPTFFAGLLLAYVFYFLLDWAPSPMGRLDPMFSPPPTLTGLYLVDAALAGDPAMWWASLKQLILPVLTMAIFVLAPIARMTRASMLSVLSADFIRTARASGLSRGTVLVTYALRNALLPVVTTLGMVFGWPGVGSYAIDALTASDYAPVQGFVLAMGCCSCC